ncbi:MAG: class I SAM-dependent methyltransferase [Gemmatimonadetes bacterium]|uniref:Class I SAM-dependent methyltransferase n=1 Tax=Candidatus Kutchimonas denitrificans TaxID=3056748 RepID=A0AAE4ZAA4_9BACT|nr:class I SAM-dependent methyltransferase [Gemmatimonadota bacterium]NIR75943.1 class I SAM-dependent methyltransferase [Candidatus Kutchimonas denitrificans]NIS02101.1 class I SAM-dependent methyltransferase [Gemmatimonadota bacterium]NIT67926.1 class I SAM-dependent methyltransferase [Gemmatimonadota bacterium]NIU53920.1 hypothetical protein [Gemmatimonadota bacterium]
MNCCHCQTAERQFDAARAERDLRSYLHNGPGKTTRTILDAVRRSGEPIATLLDIGGGVGVIPFELLAVATESATMVEGASAYIETSRSESQRRDMADRIRYLHADFVEIAERVADADLVTLDRVICCYEGFERLVAESAAKCGRLYAFSIPRDRWHVRAFVALQNLMRRIRGSSFRTWVHPVRRIEDLLVEAGLEPRFESNGLVWRVSVFVRPRGANAPAEGRSSTADQRIPNLADPIG